MQFIWKYIDDFMGKGLSYFIITELLIYASSNLVTLALPLAVLLSSIMTFGNLAEHYELVAMKSSGLSLIKIMQPLLIFILFLSAGAFYFTNNISPVANLKFKSLLWDITQKKPSLELTPGVFYNGIEGYSIRISDKSADGQWLNDLLIYKHDKTIPGNRTVIRAEKATMKKAADNQHLIMHMYNGVSYDENSSAKTHKNNFSHIKNTFEEEIVKIDISGFDLKRSDQDLWKNHIQMLTMGQLDDAIDSLTRQDAHQRSNYLAYMTRGVSLYKKDSLEKAAPAPPPPAIYFDSLSTTDKKRTINIAINNTRNAKNYMAGMEQAFKGREEYIDKHRIEWHRKLTLPFTCIILFFIGAPLGAIIKKGGLGMPVIFSVIFFLIFHITSISGENIAESGGLTPFAGMWLSSAVLFPIALFLTYKAANDAPLFDRDTYARLWDRLKNLFHPHKSQA